MSVIDRASSALSRFLYGDLNARASSLTAAGGLTIGGPRPYAVWPNYDLDGQVSRAFRIATVMACIDAIARDVSAAPLRVYREVKGQPEAQATHAARLVIAEPNPAMSESEFWRFAVSMMAATGFCVIEKVRSGAGRPVQLWPLISPWLKVRPVPQQLPDWEYRVPGNDPWKLAAEDVILLTYLPDMWGSWTGRTPLTALKRELAIDDFMSDFLNTLFERGGVPPIGLRVLPQDGRVPPVSEAERDRILETFASKYGGSGNWGKPAFLGGLSVEKIGLNLNEMAYSEVREYVELHICSAFGVPAGMIGTSAGLARNTYSNAETDLTKYYSGTIAPLWTRVSGAFTRGLVREFDASGNLSAMFDTDAVQALQEDAEPKWVHAVSALSVGLITVNQAQTEIGLPGFGAAGDVLLLPFSATVIRPEDLLIEADATAAPPDPVPAALAPFADPDATPDDAPSEESDDERGSDFSVRVQTPSGVGYRANTATRQRIQERSRKTLARLAKKGTPMLRAFWRKQGARIAAAATRSIIPTETRDIAEVDWLAEEAELAKVLNLFYALNGETAFGEASNLLGVEIAWDLSHPNIRQLMNSLGYRIRGIAETTRADVSRVIVESLDEGVSMTDLASRIETMFTQTYANRAMTVSRTESMYAYGRSSATAYETSGVVSAIECLDNPDHTEHYDGALDNLSCSERNGTVSPLDMAELHLESEHVNGSLSLSPVLTVPLGED